MHNYFNLKLRGHSSSNVPVKNIPIVVIILALFVVFSNNVKASVYDAKIQYALGIAAKQKGMPDKEFDHYKNSCLYENGLAKACLAWAKLAKNKNDEQSQKIALGSAVMLEPENPQARFFLAMFLLEKEDYLWAIRHLKKAHKLFEDENLKAATSYYLGYAAYKNGDYKMAEKYLSDDKTHLDKKLRKRQKYYLALTHLKLEKTHEALLIFEQISDKSGSKWSIASSKYLTNTGSFSSKSSVSGRASASIGIDTHPQTAFLDTSSNDPQPVLFSVFRGDLSAKLGKNKHTVSTMATVLRQQNWTEIARSKESDIETLADLFEPRDFNLTFFLLQVDYRYRFFTKQLEHQLKIGLDEETQFLDRMPVKVDPNVSLTGYKKSDNSFEKIQAASGLKIWWSTANNSNTRNHFKFKVEIRPNYLDPDRDAVRFRWRYAHDRYFLRLRLKLMAMAGFRYDRTYSNPAVIKYDRLLPEFELLLRHEIWLKRLSAILVFKAKHNMYINSKGDDDNSFLPAYADTGGLSKSKYLAQTRKDFEWEIKTELELSLWKKSTLNLLWRHHQRLSNLDSTWIPEIPGTDTDINYGYKQDVWSLELRQMF